MDSHVEINNRTMFHSHVEVNNGTMFHSHVEVNNGTMFHSHVEVNNGTMFHSVIALIKRLIIFGGLIHYTRCSNMIHIVLMFSTHADPFSLDTIQKTNTTTVIILLQVQTKKVINNVLDSRSFKALMHCIT